MRFRSSRLLVAIALLAVVSGLAFVRMWPPLATVMSGSMSPTINTGDMVVLQKLDRPARVGDIVVVNVPDDARSRYGYPPVVIHRIVRIAAGGTVTTKGDARKETDPFTVPRRALSAHVIGHIPAAGRAMAFFTSPLGLLWLAGGAVLLIGMPLLEGRRAGQRTLADELQHLRAEREASDQRCDELSQELSRVTAAFTEQLAQLPAQLEAAVAAAVQGGPQAAAPPTAEIAARPEPTGPPPVALVAAAVVWTRREPAGPPPVATVAAAMAWAHPEPAGPPPVAIVAAAVTWTAAPADALAQLELALFRGPRVDVAADESDAQLAFALEVERAPRFARPCADQLAFALEERAAKPDQLVFSSPPPRPAWDARPRSIVIRRRSGGLVGRALTMLVA